MTIYADINGSWGPADELVFINDERWETADYDELSTWNDLLVIKFTNTHDGRTPREWITNYMKQKGRV